MQELRFVAVSEDGSYAVLAVPGRSGRFVLPIDERLRAVALGQTSRLAQYDIEVESPLRPKEIQARIRAGETAEEIADAAGIPVERVRWFEGPVLAERAYIANQSQAASVRRVGDSAGPGPRLGEVVPVRLKAAGSDPEDAQWDSRKRGDGNWQVTLTFPSGGRLHVAEWVFDPRRRHVLPDDDNAARLSLPESELPPVPAPVPGEATVTPIASRLGAAAGMGGGGGLGGASHGNPGHGGGPGGNRFRPERSVIPDRSLGADRSLAADRTQAADRSKAADRPPAADRPGAQEPAAHERAAADRSLPDQYAVSDYIAAAEHAALVDRQSLAYSPAATPVLPRPGHPAPDPPDPAATVDETERTQAPASRHVVFEDPEPTMPDDELEPEHAAPPPAQHQPAAKAAAPAAPAAKPRDVTAAGAAEPGGDPQPAAAEIVPAVSVSAPAVAVEKPAGPVAAEATAPQPAGEEQSSRPRAGKKNARARRSSVPSWDEIMLGSTRQRD